jgi:hypothetical protein
MSVPTQDELRERMRQHCIAKIKEADELQKKLMAARAEIEGLKRRLAIAERSPRAARD